MVPGDQAAALAATVATVLDDLDALTEPRS
jgi:hypothetical protein